MVPLADGATVMLQLEKKGTSAHEKSKTSQLNLLLNMREESKAEEQMNFSLVSLS